MPNVSPAASAVAILLGAASAFAQQPAVEEVETPETTVYGFEVSAPGFPTGIERARQPDLWMLDVDFKPMRMRYVDVTDPATGETNRELVWYLVYRVYNRPIRGAEIQANTVPVNELDPPLTRPLFMPQLTLITYDRQESEIPLQQMDDAPNKDIVEQLARIENRRDIKVKGSLDLIGELPPAADDVKPVYGIAVFRNVDPDTDFFKVILKGFTNLYEVRDEEGGKRIWRKALVQRFSRRGDRYDPSQAEFEFIGDPEWVYLPDAMIENDDVIAASE